MGKVDRNHRLRGLKYKDANLPEPTGPCPTPFKVSHSSRKHAKLAKRQQERSRHNLALRTYRCECGCWHVGTLHEETRAEARAVARRKLETTA